MLPYPQTTFGRPLAALALLSVLATPAVAHETQGVVTGRLYTELDTTDDAMNDFHDLTLGWIRIEFEEFINEYHGLAYDDPIIQGRKAMFQNVIEKAHERGIKVLGLVSWNSFPDAPGFPDTDSSLQAYVDAVRWHLDSYDVDAVEIWNEPEGFSVFQGKLNRYAKMMVMTYSQLKPLYPDRIFVGPATANAERGHWIGIGRKPNYESTIFNSAAMLEYRATHGGALPADVVSWHAYGASGKPDTTSFYGGKTFYGYFDEIKAYTDRTGRNVIGNTPIWFTEWGWDSNSVGLENQRVYQQIMIKMIVNRPQIKVPFWYDYRDDENVPGTEYKAFGLRLSSAGGLATKRVFYSFMAHSNLVGLYTPEGVNEWPIDQVIDKYLAIGGRAAAGHPFNDGGPWYGDKVHDWGAGGKLQTFMDGSLGMLAIAIKNGASAACVLEGDFWLEFRNGGGPDAFGWPSADQSWDNGVGAFVQFFDYGYMQQRPTEPVTWVPTATFTLSWAAAGPGSVDRSPLGGDPVSPSAAGSAEYFGGTTVTLTALPEPGYEFTSWTGPVASPASAATTVRMDGATSVAANFGVLMRTLSWSVTGKGTISRSPLGSNATSPSSSGSSSYPDGTTVTLTANAGNGQRFLSWTGPVSNPAVATTTVPMDAVRSVTANFGH